MVARGGCRLLPGDGERQRLRVVLAADPATCQQQEEAPPQRPSPVLVPGHLNWEAWPVARTLPRHPRCAAGVQRRRAAGEHELALVPVRCAGSVGGRAEAATGVIELIWSGRPGC